MRLNKEFFADYLCEDSLADTYIVYIFLKKLLLSFDKWEAYKLGLIDKDGNVLKKPATPKEKNAFTILDRVILKLKRMLPGGFLGHLSLYFFLRDWHIPSTDDEFLVEKEKKQNLEAFLKEYQEISYKYNIREEDFVNFMIKRSVEENVSKKPEADDKAVVNE